MKIGRIETPSHTLHLKFSGVDGSDDTFRMPDDTLSLGYNSGSSKAATVDKQSAAMSAFPRGTVDAHASENTIRPKSVAAETPLPELVDLTIAPDGGSIGPRAPKNEKARDSNDAELVQKVKCYM